MDARAKLETTLASYEKMSGWKPLSYVFIVLGFLVAIGGAFLPQLLIWVSRYLFADLYCGPF